MKKILIGLLTIFISTGAFAEDNWVEIASSESSSKIFVNAITIKKEGKYTKAWLMYDIKHPESYQNKKIRSIKQLTYINCEAGTYKVASSAFYEKSAGKGSPALIDDTPEYAQQEKHIIPDTVIFGVKEVLCSL